MNEVIDKSLGNNGVMQFYIKKDPPKIKKKKIKELIKVIEKAEIHFSNKKFELAYEFDYCYSWVVRSNNSKFTAYFDDLHSAVKVIRGLKQ